MSEHPSPKFSRRASDRSPRTYADKSSKKALLTAIRATLRVESAAVRHNTQTFNRGRYAAVASLPDYEELKDRARAIKEVAIARLPELMETLGESVRRNGGHFYVASDASDAARYVTEVCKRSRVRLAVKGKSMTSEEIRLNHALEAAGIEVAETDLAEFILQVADEQPSHVIAPAVHYSRERISALFKRKFRTDEPLETGEELTAFARKMLRRKFLAADAGITGANFVIADSGSIVLVESEANIRMTTAMPSLHIAISGAEKILPTRADLAPFIELLAASATGQLMSSYTSILRPPLMDVPVLTDGGQAPQREFHLVILDNGRSAMRDDAVLREALYCIRCSACLNSCANFQTVGGHAFGGETYSGGIGGAWEAGTRGLDHARFSELCTGCSRCVNQCPVRIDVPGLNTELRTRLNKRETTIASRGLAALVAGGDAREEASLEKLFFGRYDVCGRWGSKFARVANRANESKMTRKIMERVFGMDHRRAMPRFASPTFVEAAAKRERSARTKRSEPTGKVVLFADVFTNYGSPNRGLATLRVLEAAGADVIVSAVCADGRAALSQGLVKTARQQAQRTADLLERYIGQGREIVVVEPSVLAMFRMEYRTLLDGDGMRGRFERIRSHCFDPCEYLVTLLSQHQLNPQDIFPAADQPRGTLVMLHSHCQQRTIGAAAAVEGLLRLCGFDVATTNVECCGMAGSFGYKKEYYDLSMAVGRQLFEQVQSAESSGGARTLVASGTSCQEQLHVGLERRVLHPMELLAETIEEIEGRARRAAPKSRARFS